MDGAATLRKDLPPSREEVRELTEELTRAHAKAAQAVGRSERLTEALQEAREQITALKEEVDKLCAPPSTYGVYLSVNEDGTVNILAQGRKVKVNLHPALKVETLKPGQELVLNEGLNVVEAAGYEIQGDVVILKEQLDPERAVVTLRADEEKVGIIADPLRQARLKTGDHLLMDAKSGYLLEKLPKSEVEDLSLEEVPDIGYEQIGGLGSQIEAIKDAVELPYLYADYYKEHKLTPPKGVLLYGPPGCGKTMIAKAVANNLAEKISEKRGEKVNGYFLDDENRFLEVTYGNGDKEVLYFKDFASGAMIESVVRRAKKLALKRYIQGREKGITSDDLLNAVREEFKENEDLPNTTNPDDWAKIAGKKGERIVYVKSLVGDAKEKQKNVEKVLTTGHYL